MDPVWEAVATALATKAAHAAVEGGRSAWAALVRLVRERVAGEPAAERAWEAAVADPADAGSVASLARVLADAERESPEFGAELRSLWQRIAAGAPAEAAVVNRIAGEAERAVQARDIHGGVTFGDTADRPHER